MDIRPFHKNQILEIHIAQSQCGITCGAIDEPSRSSKAIDKHVIINFRDKNVVIARFRKSAKDPLRIRPIEKGLLMS